MNSPPHVYGADKLIDTLVENSELAYNDARAIIAAIDKQTDLLKDVLDTLRLISSDLKQQNTPYQADTRVIQLDGAKPIDAAMAWLRENDPELKLTAREAALRASMSQATINRAQQRLRGK